MLTKDQILIELLDCGYDDLSMLTDSNIDVTSAVNDLYENGSKISLNGILYEAFWDKVYECFGDAFDNDPMAQSRDFKIYTNCGCTSMYIRNGKSEYYPNKYPDEIEAIESYMGIEFDGAE